MVNDFSFFKKIGAITDDPASLLALLFGVIGDLVVVVIEKYAWRVWPLLGRLEVGKVMYVDGILS